MKNRIQVLIVLAMMVAACTALSFGQRPGRFGPGGGPHSGQRFRINEMGGFDFEASQWRRVLRRLDLTEEQRAAIQAIAAEHRDSLQPLREALRENRRLLEEATMAEAPDTALISELAIAQGDLLGQMTYSAALLKIHVMDELTAEQKAQLEEMRGERRTRRSAD